MGEDKTFLSHWQEFKISQILHSNPGSDSTLISSFFPSLKSLKDLYVLKSSADTSHNRDENLDKNKRNAATQ